MPIRLAAASVESLLTEAASLAFNKANGVGTLLLMSCLPAPGASRPRYVVMVVRWSLRGAFLIMRPP